MSSDQEIYPISQMRVEQRGRGPRVIFVHGGEEEGGLVAFSTQLPLAATYTLIIPDLPGHGQSPAQGRATAERDALLVAELLDNGAHLVGHSYGGAVALRVAATRPDAVRSLTLIEPATLDIGVGDPEVRAMLIELVQAVAIPDLRERLIAFARVVGIHKAWPDILPDMYRRLAEDLPGLLTPPAAGSVTTRQLTDTVAAAGIRSLIISGGHRVAWEHLCDMMAEALGGQRDVLSGFSHAVQQCGALFNARLEQFWQQLT